LNTFAFSGVIKRDVYSHEKLHRVSKQEVGLAATLLGARALKSQNWAKSAKMSGEILEVFGKGVRVDVPGGYIEGLRGPELPVKLVTECGLS